MKIEYIAHASILLKSDNCSLLTDPFYFFEPILAQSVCHFPPRDISKEMFGKIDYVYSSHKHLDHSHPETLRQLKNQVETVLLPAERPELEARYRDIGYRDIILLGNGETLKLKEGIEVASYWDDPVDSVLLVKMDGKTVLHQNDCVGLKPKTLAKIAEIFSIDYAFLLYTATFNLYPLMLPRSEPELCRMTLEKEKALLDYQFDVINSLKPKKVIPYSMTVIYFQPDQIHLNGYCRITPPLFSNILKDVYPDGQCWVIQPGDIIDTKLDTVINFHSKNFWGENLESFLQNITDYSTLNEKHLSRFDFGEPKKYEDLFINYIQNRFSLPFISFLNRKVIAIQIVGNTSKIDYILDLKNKKICGLNLKEEALSTNYFLEIIMPATILELFLLRKCEKYIMSISLSYTNRVYFRFNNPPKISPQNEIKAYILSLVSIFDYQLQQKLIQGDISLDDIFI
jgi:UDP-MurNAc hydroxylase